MHPNILYIVQFPIPNYNTSTFWDIVFKSDFNKKIHVDWKKSSYFSRIMHANILYTVVQFQIPSYNTYRDINYFLIWFLV